ncbi:MYG1 protein C27H6.8 [Ditylenchus destructor]|uniref:MYG1 protein C27H6.8 n=1 Tax=Ditylenchus destructor TaxID=166010 RepID=A0AAD4MLG2_9BILA|nr:MYG1 protein C27H6.8 [Ditylenchus destructor]
MEVNNSHEVRFELPAMQPPLEGSLCSGRREREETRDIFCVRDVTFHFSWPMELHSLEHFIGAPDGKIRYDGVLSCYLLKKVPEFSKYEIISPRALLPNKWHGLMNCDLEEKSGINGAVFVHRKGHTGGALTKQAVLLMAQKGIQVSKELRDGKRLAIFIPGKFVPISLFHCDKPAKSDSQWFLLVLVVSTGLPHIQQISIPLPFFGRDGESELNKYGLLETAFVHFTKRQEDCVHNRVKMALQKLRNSNETNPKMWHRKLMTAAREGQKEASKLEKRAENREKCIIS